MKAAIFYGGKDIRVDDVPMPEPGAGEVQIKIMSAGVCGSDLHPYRVHNPYGVREPHQRGHELAGEEICCLGQAICISYNSFTLMWLIWCNAQYL